LQCAAIQAALRGGRPSAEQQDKWTDSFIDELLQRMQTHEGQLDVYVKRLSLHGGA